MRDRNGPWPAGAAAPSGREQAATARAVPEAELEEPVSGPARRRWSVVWPLSLPFLAFLALPLLALLFSIPPARLLARLGDPQVLQAVGLSLSTSLVSTVVTVALGTPVSYLLARRQFRGKRAVDTLVDLPTVLPPAVAGVALLLAFGRRSLVGGLLGDLGIQIAFTQVAVVMAQTFVAAPFYVKAAMLGLSSINPELEQAAALDGASSWQVFRHVTVPLAWVSLVAGAAMTWARAMGEFGATIIFAGNYPGRTQTMPLAVYLGFELDLDVALTLAVILMAFSFMVLLLVKGMLHREPRS